MQSPFVHRSESAPQRPPSGGLQRSWQPQTLHCTALPAIVGLSTRRRYTAVRRMRRQPVSRRLAVAGMSACTGDDPFGNTKQDLYTEVKGTYARPKHSTRVLVALIGPDRSLEVRPEFTDKRDWRRRRRKGLCELQRHLH